MATRWVAKRSPKVAFFECDGRNPLDNLGTYYVAHWYPTYVTGVAAGLMSKSGKLGYVGSFPVPSVFSGTNSFLMGARSVNPNATIQVININSWFDPQAATQAGSANPPALSNVALQGAPSPVSGVVTLGWTASDADGDPLTFDIFYSRDNGTTFNQSR